MKHTHSTPIEASMKTDIPTYQQLFDLLPPVDQAVARTRPGNIDLVKALLREERDLVAMSAVAMGNRTCTMKSPRGGTVTIKDSLTQLGVLAALDLGDGVRTPDELMATARQTLNTFKRRK